MKWLCTKCILQMSVCPTYCETNLVLSGIIAGNFMASVGIFVGEGVVLANTKKAPGFALGHTST